MLLQSTAVHFLRQTVLSMFDNLRLTNFDLDGTDLLTTKDSAREFIIWNLEIILDITQYTLSLYVRNLQIVVK